MNVSYGPPGHRGVTHLMAIGDVDESPDPASRNVMIAAVATAGVGFMIGSATARNVGLGAVLGLLAVQWMRSRRKVEITTPR